MALKEFFCLFVSEGLNHWPNNNARRYYCQVFPPAWTLTHPKRTSVPVRESATRHLHHTAFCAVQVSGPLTICEH